MNERDSFSNSICEEQVQLGERELYSFLAAVAELYGPGQARISAEDWIEESDRIDVPPRSARRDWRAVSIAASARMASRIDAALHRQNPLPSLTENGMSPIPCDYSASTLLV